MKLNIWKKELAKPMKITCKDWDLTVQRHMSQNNIFRDTRIYIWHLKKKNLLMPHFMYNKSGELTNACKIYGYF